MSLALLSGTFSATGQSDTVSIRGHFNVSLSGFGSGTIGVQRSFDSGGTWLTIEEFTSDVERRGYEQEIDVIYRLNCSSYSSGTLAYRISK